MFSIFDSFSFSYLESFKFLAAASHRALPTAHRETLRAEVSAAARWAYAERWKRKQSAEQFETLFRKSPALTPTCYTLSKKSLILGSNIRKPLHNMKVTSNHCFELNPNGSFYSIYSSFVVPNLMTAQCNERVILLSFLPALRGARAGL